MAIYDVNGNVISRAYDKDGSIGSHLYDVNGNLLSANVDYSDYNVQNNYLNSGVANDQGFDVYDGYIFQFRAGGSGAATGDYVAVLNASTGAVVNQFAITAGHGDSAQFSEEYYAQSDQFPFLYVSADTSPYVYINRVTTNSATLVKTLKFDYAVAGYNPNCAYDENNQILYMVGTTKDDWLTDVGGTNETLVSKWDMTNITENGDGTFTPQFVSSYTIPFIYVMQGIRYHDGMIWIPSGYGNKPSYLYAINPETGVYEYTFNLNTTVEVEGTAFLTPTQMLVGFQGGRYDLYTFSAVN